ncbi:MAG TPA: hypothetical protein VFV90_07625 [Usitatibacter sp.]|nr:hypothetical protein [Usitatibacter sp.]
MLKDQTTLKGVVAGATFESYQAHERAMVVDFGASHGEVLDEVVRAGLDALSGIKSRGKKPAKKK